MPGPLKEETALLLADYFQHRLGGTALPPSPAAEALRRAAGELESREQPFFRSPKNRMASITSSTDMALNQLTRAIP
ncbi:anti-apoptotic protein NR13 [Alligator mississippiensis]|uniref:Anti-apoptotic protein NR13 n=1 Tax=Alligator mississippiensis TaxID=8496 RepID=A0A151M9M3_ALLMI|nr:anti-apoptotic protein NR13 [Alligator mississippiensis]